MKFDSISIYDKSDNLISYVEYNSEVDVKCYYSASGRRLMRKFTNQYEEDTNTPYSNNGDSNAEIVSSILEYDDDITLYPLHIHGETAMRVLQSGTTTLNAANVVSRIDSYSDLYIDTYNSSYTSNFSNTSIECHTVNQDLIDNLKNKL